MKLPSKAYFAMATGLVFLATLGCSNTGNNASNTGNPGYADRNAAADRPANTPPANLSSTDRDFAMKAAQGGMAEVELGNLAQQRGSSAAVKDFGKKLVTDHTKANNDLKDIAVKDGITLPADVDAAHRKTIDRLSKLSGAQFDREFLKDAVKDHREDISEFEKQADKGTDPALKNFASSNLPTLRDHLSMAESAQGRRTTSSTKSSSSSRSSASQPSTR